MEHVRGRPAGRYSTREREMHTRRDVRGDAHAVHAVYSIPVADRALATARAITAAVISPHFAQNSPLLLPHAEKRARATKAQRQQARASIPL